MTTVVSTPGLPADALQRHNLPHGAPDDFFYPVSRQQLGDLIGKMLTHIEAMGLPERAEAANKSLVRNALTAWFASVEDNSRTSYRGCLAPIQMLRLPGGKERKAVWLAEGNHAVSLNLEEEPDGN